MTLYVINESKSRRIANDISIYRSLEALSFDLEPIDVENHEFFLFDTDGNFYEINNTENVDQFEFRKTDSDIELARKVISDYLICIGKRYCDELDLEENVKTLE